MGMLALEFSGLNSSFQGLNCVWWWGTVPMKEMVKKEIGFGMTWTGLEDLNGWIGDRIRAGITNAFGVPGEDKVKE